MICSLVVVRGRLCHAMHLGGLWNVDFLCFLVVSCAGVCLCGGLLVGGGHTLLGV
jgi:hypothetical protein